MIRPFTNVKVTNSGVKSTLENQYPFLGNCNGHALQ
jgi:hypothetical protein